MPSPLANIYARLPVAFTHGQGVWLWDAQGRKYLDALAGIGVSCLGHAHPKLVTATPNRPRAHPHVQHLRDPAAGRAGRRLTEAAWPPTCRKRPTA